MIFLISVIIQTIVAAFVMWLCHYIFWTIANTVRLFLFYRCDSDTFTYEEKIQLRIIEINQSETLVVEPTHGSPDDYWDRIDQKYDVQFKQSRDDPDEILFQGRVKRQKRR